MAGAPTVGDPVDVHVGARMRLRRRVLGMKQEELADRIGVTFQQVQKYERGLNRVSASRLYRTAHVLSVSVAYFFDGLPEPNATGDTAAEKELIAFLGTPDGFELATNFPKIETPGLRRSVLDLVREMSMLA